MTRLVLDASVIVKWGLPDPQQERHVAQALRLLHQYEHGEVTLSEPPHWLLEVASVLVRLNPSRAAVQVQTLRNLSLEADHSAATLEQAIQLADSLQHHLFDTLYHAVALQQDAVLVTADDRYFRKAQSLGSIARLADYPS